MYEINDIKQCQRFINDVNIVSKTDLKGKIIYVNDNFCEISGYSREYLIGKPHNIVRHPDMPKEVFKELRDTIKNKKQSWKGIIKNKNKNGQSYWVKATIFPVFDNDGNVIEYISIRTDVTDLEIAKNVLRKSFTKLQELDKKKDDFLNVSSHELRTPMTSIKGYLSMIIDGDIGNVNDEAKFYLSKIYSDVENLLGLINDMLDITKIESGNIKFENNVLDLRKILDEVIFNANNLSIKKNIKIKSEIQYDNLKFIGDKQKLKQVILNILDNAVKFTPNDGIVEVKSFVLNDEINIIIKDSGIGIEKKDFKKIFNKFGQIKNSLTRDIGGTGLGLSISKSIIKHYKGKIKLESEFGKGSEFTIILPIK